MTMRMFLRLQYIELDELPGTSARRRYHLVIYMCSFFACLDFVVAFITLALSSHGHLRPPLLDWLFNTPLGLFAFTVLAILVTGLPLAALQWQAGQTRGELARAPDMTDAAPDAWEEVSVRRPVERSTIIWLGQEPRERRVNRLLLMVALGLALGLVALWVAAVINVVPGVFFERCTGARCAPDFPLMALGSAVMGATLVMPFIARSIWIARVERACGIWLRHRRAVVNGSSLCYIRKPGESTEQATQAIQRFAIATRPPIASGCLITLLTLTPLILLIPALMVLSAWLGTQWTP